MDAVTERLEAAIREALTPAVVVDGPTVRSNLERMAGYARRHRLTLRPHTKTHKSKRLARLQLESGASGLTVAKPAEASVMAEIAEEIFVAYPPVDAARARQLADLARHRKLRIAIDHPRAAEQMDAAAASAGSRVEVVIDLDVGAGRTGVRPGDDALRLAQRVDRCPNLDLRGVLFFLGHLKAVPEQQAPELRAIGERLEGLKAAWDRAGLCLEVVSGGSTPTAFQSHEIALLTEIRPGTYVFNDMNGVHGGVSSLEQCAARLLATVISDAVPGQVVIDAGSKMLTSDRCTSAPDSGFGSVLGFPEARIRKLSEEHGQIDVSPCSQPPRVGDRLWIVPNHICPCINLQETFWWVENGEAEPWRVDARGAVC